MHSHEYYSCISHLYVWQKIPFFFWVSILSSIAKETTKTTKQQKTNKHKNKWNWIKQ